MVTGWLIGDGRLLGWVACEQALSWVPGPFSANPPMRTCSQSSRGIDTVYRLRYCVTRLLSSCSLIMLIFYIFTEQIEDGVGTAQDDLALKREEEEQMKIKRMKYLPNDGGDHC